MQTICQTSHEIKQQIILNQFEMTRYIYIIFHQMNNRQMIDSLDQACESTLPSTPLLTSILDKLLQQHLPQLRKLVDIAQKGLIHPNDSASTQPAPHIAPD